MKKIEAIIRKSRFEDVKKALSAGKQADLNRLPFTLLLMRLWNGHTMG